MNAEFIYTEEGFDPKKTLARGNRFLLGNGHLGYRGTLEENSLPEMVELNIVGFYDRFEGKWRESVNAPNPFLVRIKANGLPCEVGLRAPTSHQMRLDLRHAVFSRETVYPEITISTERFVSADTDSLLAMRYSLRANAETALEITYGIDEKISECNGPHLPSRQFAAAEPFVIFHGLTNEGKTLDEIAVYSWSRPLAASSLDAASGLRKATLSLHKGDSLVLEVIALVLPETQKSVVLRQAQEAQDQGYEALRKKHTESFSRRWEMADVKIDGDKDAQFELRYSIYHLLIVSNVLGTSIPARGVSGETYKGAIFWDSEIFLLPFYTLTAPEVAASLLRYRIKTLNGAKAKAREFGYQGAFYAWESQDDGKEACSLYNVSDPVTGQPLRTYFNEKQIHISADIVYAFMQYLRFTGDERILAEGGWNVIYECALFLASYSQKEGLAYHLNDVIGPDEYHERVDDNAFTAGLAEYAVEAALGIAAKNPALLRPGQNIAILKDFAEHLYVPQPDETGLISQFKGYFLLEDTDVPTVRARLRNPNEYWGGAKGVATPTRVIKQADVATLLVLRGDDYSLAAKKRNYDFYYPCTEHGSSLSASMYSLLASEIGYREEAYKMFRKSSSVDLGDDQKMYAGGIYIGGTHPASNAGAYLSVVLGWAGLKEQNGKLTACPRLPSSVGGLSFSVFFKGEKYRLIITKSESKIFKEQTI